jgi:molecular chaperone IbpA
MLTYDFSPLLRTAIGFERLARQVEAAQHYDDTPAYPPYNIESPGDDVYRITIAAAGFEESELAVEVKENTLLISGRKADKGEKADVIYLHRGIAERDFVRKFELADYVKVNGANFADGLLTIDLVREVPDELKPRTIEIRTEAPKSLIDRARKFIEAPAKKEKAA